MPSTRPPPTPPAPPRNARFGPYTLLDRIAVGGMAEVFRASEPRSAGEPRVIALKRMLPHVAAHPEARAMFEEEARLGLLVSHPNVVRVLGRGEEAGQPFLALEYVPGVDLWRLGRWLGHEGHRLSIPLAVLLVGDLLAGLHAVHEATDEDGRPLGIVHRDVSPSNVLLSHHGQVKLGDLGIARHRLQKSWGIGGLPQRAKGKLKYLSPEQVEGGEVGRRSDVFSSAVIAAELLTGKPLFTGDSELEVLLAIRDGKIGSLLREPDPLPRRLAETVEAALARQPEDRMPDAHTFRERLVEHAGPEPPLRRELAALVADAMGSPDDTPDSTPLQDTGWPRPALPATPGRRPTSELPALEYQVRTATGDLHGPWNYARVVEALSTGSVRATDRVSVGGGAFRPLAEVPELERHLPPGSPAEIPATASHRIGAAGSLALACGGIITALGRSVLRRDTGRWTCEQGRIQKEVFVQAGVPEFVTSNLAGELLGEYLVGRSVISRSELDMALAVMPRFEGRLGDTVVALGLVEPVELFRHIAEQVREKLLELFLWRGGTATYGAGVEPPASGFPLGLEPWQILFEGVERRLAAGLEASPYKDPRARLRRCDPLPADVVVDRLPGRMARLLRDLETPTEVARLAPDPSRPTDDLKGAIVLAHLGAARWER